MSRTFKDMPRHVRVRKNYFKTRDMVHNHSLLGHTAYHRIPATDEFGEIIQSEMFHKGFENQDYKDFIFKLQSRGILYTKSYGDDCFHFVNNLEDLNGAPLYCIKVRPFKYSISTEYKDECSMDFFDKHFKKRSDELLHWRFKDVDNKVLPCYPILREYWEACYCCIDRDENYYEKRSARQDARNQNIRYAKAYNTGSRDVEMHDYDL